MKKIKLVNEEQTINITLNHFGGKKRVKAIIMPGTKVIKLLDPVTPGKYSL